MLCLKPKWITIKYKESQRPVLDEYQAYNDGKIMLVPCGKCLACKTRYATEWAKRCVCQTTTSKNNYFLTLTYDDAHLPLTLKQVANDFTNLIKKMRKFKQFCKCKYLMVGERGKKSGRLHAHALVWNFPIEKQRKWVESHQCDMKQWQKDMIKKYQFFIENIKKDPLGFYKNWTAEQKQKEIEHWKNEIKIVMGEQND